MTSQRSTATVTTQWYNLPKATENTPILAVSAAGNIYHHDVNGIEQDGMELKLEYATYKDGKVSNTGEAELSDVGATPKWRNLRIRWLTCRKTLTSFAWWLRTTPLMRTTGWHSRHRVCRSWPPSTRNSLLRRRRCWTGLLPCSSCASARSTTMRA